MTWTMGPSSLSANMKQKFHKGKCKVLHLVRNKPMHPCSKGWGAAGQKAALQKTLVLLNTNEQCFLAAKKGRQHPELR